MGGLSDCFWPSTVCPYPPAAPALSTLRGRSPRNVHLLLSERFPQQCRFLCAIPVKFSYIKGVVNGFATNAPGPLPPVGNPGYSRNFPAFLYQHPPWVRGNQKPAVRHGRHGAALIKYRAQRTRFDEDPSKGSMNHVKAPLGPIEERSNILKRRCGVYPRFPSLVQGTSVPNLQAGINPASTRGGP